MKFNFLPGAHFLSLDDMSKIITSLIESEAKKLIKRHQMYAYSIDDEVKRIGKRTGSLPQKIVHIPSYWRCNDGFDPYHVRKQSDIIGHSIERKLKNKTYLPFSAVSYQVPKSPTEMRSVSVFQVADNAISRLIYKNLLEKNAPRLSARCYAYRTDLTIHDAVLHLATEMRTKSRLFVAEFDFKKYFDTISHEHLFKILKDKKFFVTPSELMIMKAFLSTPTLPESKYIPISAKRDSTFGIPQGTSISLFLANIAAYTLDRRLESLGVGFVRYADDTIVWSSDYSKICLAASALEESAWEMGVELNLKKSEGISLITTEKAPAEFKYKHSVTFVGYNIGTTKLSIRDKSIRNIKEKIAQLIYLNLIEGVKAGNIVPARFAQPIDRDYLTMLRQIRRYLYGNLNETQLKRYLSRHTPKFHYKGLMSFYPIVDDVDQLKALDGWLLHTVFTSLRKREKLIRAAGHTTLPAPHGLSSKNLLKFMGKSSKGAILDLRLPSFVRISKLINKAARAYGANQVANIRSRRYYPEE